jgi:hypothetical protein
VRKLCWLLVFAFVLGDASVVLAESRVTINNNANDTIYVSRAYRGLKNGVANEGWEAVEPGDSVTFWEADEADLHIRVEKNGREVTFNGGFDTRNFLLIRRAFTAKLSDTDPAITILEWEAGGRNVVRIKPGDPLPRGWMWARYIRIAPGGEVRLSIRP